MTDRGQDETWTRKLSPEAKRLVASPAASHQDLGETDVLLRTTREVSTADRAALASTGATVRSVAGDVLTARVPVTRLEALSRLDFVAYVEISRPLRPERPPGVKGEGG